MIYVMDHSKICRNSIWKICSDMVCLRRTYQFKSLKRLSSTNFTSSILEYFAPILSFSRSSCLTRSFSLTRIRIFLVNKNCYFVSFEKYSKCIRLSVCCLYNNELIMLETNRNLFWEMLLRNVHIFCCFLKNCSYQFFYLVG